MGNPSPPPLSYALLSSLIGYNDGVVLTKAHLDAIGNLVLRGDGNGNFAAVTTMRVGALGFVCVDSQNNVWIAQNAYTDDGVNWFAFNSALASYAIQFTINGVFFNFAAATGAQIAWLPFTAFSNTAYDSADPTEQQIYALQVAIAALQNQANNGGFKPLSGGPANAATTAALAANTYSNGTAGVGATLTANANGALAAIDGQTLSTGARVWVQNEASAAHNGLYVVTQVGGASAPYILTRATDANTPAQLGYGYALVLAGTIWAGYAIGIASPSSAITIGTTALNPVAFTGNAAVASEVARAEAAEAAIVTTLNGSTVSQGISSPVAGTAASAGSTHMGNAAISATGMLSSVSLYATNAASVQLVVASLSGSTFTLQSISPVIALSGGAVTTVSNWNPRVQAGWYVGVYSPSVNSPDYTTASGFTLLYCSGLLGGGVIGGTSAELTTPNIEMQVGWTILTGIAGEQEAAEAAEAAILAQLGSSTTQQGVNPPVAGTSGSSAGFTRFSDATIAANGAIQSISFYSRVSGVVQLAVASYNSGTGNFTAQNVSTAISVSVGVNTITNWNPIVQAGWYVGIYSGSVTCPDYTSPSSGHNSWSCTGLVGSASPRSANASLLFEIGWTLVEGLEGQINALAASNPTPTFNGAGFGLLGTADPTGVADSTAAFASAQAAHPDPYVPPASADYSVTSITNFGWGLWGSSKAKILTNGVAMAMPESPERISRWLAVRARLVSQIFSGSPVIFNGDSITNGALASVFENSYVSLFTRYANMGIAADEATFVNFDTTDSSGGPSFEGITFASPSTVTNGTGGPVSKSLMLQAGQSMTFAGAYAQVDVTYNETSTSTTLAFAYNGGSAYKTFTTTIGASLDVFTGPSATGQTASGTFSITNTGSNAVEITSLVRLGVLASGTPPPRLYVCRFAHGGYRFTNYGSSQVASMVRIATALAGGTKPVVIPALGTNDALGINSYATLYSNVSSYLGYWTAAGIPVRSIVPIMPWRWQASQYSSGCSFELGNAAIRDAFADGGVTKFVKTDGLDFIAFGLTSIGDGHPSDLGHFIEFNSVVDALVA